MLKELWIKDFILIEEARLALDAGLLLLTGETGAGKSIVIEALALVLGGRAQSDWVRRGAEAAAIEASFAFAPNTALAGRIAALGWPEAAAEGVLVIRRDLQAEGRSQSRINGRLATLAQVRALAEQLVDIHGQHEQQRLLEPSYQLELLDRYAGKQVAQLRTALAQLLEERAAVEQRLRRLGGDARERVRRVELLRFQAEEIRAAKLEAGEEEQLQARKRVLQHARQLFETAASAYQRLHAGGQGQPAVVDRLGQLESELTAMAQVDAALGEPLALIQGALAQLQEAARALRLYRDGIVFDPAEAERVEQRLEQLRGLFRKYGADSREVLGYLQQVESELEELAAAETRAAALQAEHARLTAEAERLAEALTAERRTAAAALTSAVTAELPGLGMPGGCLQITLEPAQLGPTGHDALQLRFSANRGEAAGDLAAIASGGELSRVMLALRVVLAAIDETPTLIFDEVDAGVGGTTAGAVGACLRRLSKGRQVLAVTHLPHIAVLADAHFALSKQTRHGRTITAIQRLEGAQRVAEVARMLGGGEAALQHARELLHGREEVAPSS